MVEIGNVEIRIQCGLCREDMSYIGNMSMDDTDVIAMGCPSKDCKNLIYISRSI